VRFAGDSPAQQHREQKGCVLCDVGMKVVEVACSCSISQQRVSDLCVIRSRV